MFESLEGKGPLILGSFATLVFVGLLMALDPVN